MLYGNGFLYIEISFANGFATSEYFNMMAPKNYT